MRCSTGRCKCIVQASGCCYKFQALICKCRSLQFVLSLAKNYSQEAKSEEKGNAGKSEGIYFERCRFINYEPIPGDFLQICCVFNAISLFFSFDLYFSVLKLACDLTKHLSMCSFNHPNVSTDFSRNSQLLKAASMPKWSVQLPSYTLGTVSYINV